MKKRIHSGGYSWEGYVIEKVWVAELDSIAVIYSGNKRFRLSDQVEAVPLKVIVTEGVFAGWFGYQETA